VRAPPSTRHSATRPFYLALPDASQPNYPARIAHQNLPHQPRRRMRRDVTWSSHDLALHVWSGGKAVIEPATIRDAARSPSFTGSFHRGWAKAFESMLAEPHTLLHRLRLGRRTIGFAVSQDRGGQAEILSIRSTRSIVPGLSHDLLLTHLGHLAARGVRTIFLESKRTTSPPGGSTTVRLYRVGAAERYYRQAAGTVDAF